MEESEKSTQLSEKSKCLELVSEKIKACSEIINQILSSCEDTEPEFSYAHVNVIINFLESISLTDREIKNDIKDKEDIGNRICGASAFPYFRKFRNNIFHGKFLYDLPDFQTIFLQEFKTAKQVLARISEYLEQVKNNITLLSKDKEPIELEDFAKNFEQDTESCGTRISALVKENEENLLEIISAMIPMARSTLLENYDQNESEKQFYYFTVKVFNLIHYDHKNVSKFYYDQKVIQKVRQMHGNLVHEFHKFDLSGEPNQYSTQKRLKLFEFYRKYALEFARIILVQATSTILKKPEQDFSSELNKCLKNINESLAIPGYDFSSMILNDVKELEKCISDYLILFAPVDNQVARQNRSLPELNDFDRLIIYDMFKEAKAKLTDSPEIRDTIFSVILSKITKFGIQKKEFEKMAERFFDNEINVKDQTKKLVTRIKYCQDEYGTTPLESLRKLEDFKRFKSIKLDGYTLKEVDETLVRMFCLNVSSKLYESINLALEDDEFMKLLIGYPGVNIEELLKRTILLFPSFVLAFERLETTRQLSLADTQEMEITSITNTILDDPFSTDTQIMYLGRLFEILTKFKVDGQFKEIELSKLNGLSQEKLMQLLCYYKSKSKIHTLNYTLITELLRHEDITEIILRTLLNISISLYQRNSKELNNCIEVLDRSLNDYLPSKRLEFEIKNTMVNLYCKKLRNSDKCDLKKQLVYLSDTETYFESPENASVFGVADKLKFMYDLAYHISLLREDHVAAFKYYEKCAQLIISEILKTENINFEESFLDLTRLSSWKEYVEDWKSKTKSANILEMIRSMAYETVEIGKENEEERHMHFMKASKLYCNVRQLEKVIGEIDSTKTLKPLANLLNDMSRNPKFAENERIGYSIQGFKYLKEGLEISRSIFEINHPQTKKFLFHLGDRLCHFQNVLSQKNENNTENIEIYKEFKTIFEQNVCSPGFKMDDKLREFQTKLKKINI